MGGHALKHCGCCGLTKSLSEFGTKARAPDGHQEWCLECNRKNNRTQRMFVNGVYVPKTHPLWKPGRYSMLDGEFFLKAKIEEEATTEGYVYIISNPAWPEQVKVGMAQKVEERLATFQTYSPHRDYEVYHTFFSKDYAKAEKKAHKALAKFYDKRSEWFQCKPDEAKRILERIL